MQIAQWIKHASLELQAFDSARLDAELLLCFVLRIDRAKVYAWPEKEIGVSQLNVLNALLLKRKLGQPIAYLIGQREFWSLEFDVCKDVLVPRPDTELIVELALQALPRRHTLPIIDAGTGSGAIATALSYQWHTDNNEAPLDITATDLSMAALTLAKQNAHKHNQSSIQFARSNWLSAFSDNTFGMIISNPPYLAKDDSHLSNNTLKHEPIGALVSGDDGLDAIRSIVDDALRAGVPGCLVLLEHGATQGAAVQALMQQARYNNIQTHQDIAGLDRVTCGYCP